MLDTMESDQVDRTVYPTKGVRISINHHRQTLGLHRVRFSFDREVVEILRRGLTFPRVAIDGSFVNGLRIWCTNDDDGTMSPTSSHTGGWAFSCPVRRVRGREDLVPVTKVDFEWERDETGPVLLIPRLPDNMLPGAVIDKLPNSQVDPETRFERAEKRLKQEMAKVFRDAPESGEGVEAPPATEPEIPIDPSTVEPPSPPAIDLRDAIAMVNELVDQLGDSVVLTIDGNGHVVAKRRIVQFIDL